MAFLDELKRRFRQTPGYAGGTLEDQLAQALRTGGDVNAGTGGQALNQQVLTPQNQGAITRPRRTYNTTLSPDEEVKFNEWKRQNAPNDTGEDYDLRGAFRAGLSPAANGHWPDTFKKPNHPTFSNESQYAVGADAARAGHWNGDQFVPPATQPPPEPVAPAGPAQSFKQRLQRSTPPQGDSFGSSGEPFSPTRPRRALPRDYISEDLQTLRDLQGQKGGWRQKVVDVLDAGNAAFGNAPRTIPTRHERALRDAQQQLGTELTVEQRQNAIQQGQMVPFQLPDGSWTQIPARSAATVGSRQQGQQATLSLRRQQMDAHSKRWDTMGRHEAARDAQALYNSGAADDNEDLRDEIAKRMGLPEGTSLPPHTQGQIKTDENGNFILVNPRSGAITTPAVPTEGTPQPVGSFAKTQLQAANTRAANAQAGATARTRMTQAGAAARAAGRVGTTQRKLSGTEVNQRTELIQGIEQARQQMTDADAILNNPQASAEEKNTAKLKRDRAQKAGQISAAGLNSMDAGYEAGPGTGGYPYYKQKGEAQAPDRAGRTIDGAIQAFTKRIGRAPNADEIAKMKAALGQ